MPVRREKERERDLISVSLHLIILHHLVRFPKFNIDVVIFFYFLRSGGDRMELVAAK